MTKTKAEYNLDKAAFAYKLYREHRYFGKARAIICKDKKLLLIKISYIDGRVHYVFPGGGVDEGEKPSVTAVREAYEEYGVRVRCIKFLGRQYYKCKVDYDGNSFISRRIDNYYICDYISTDENSPFGISGEFAAVDRKYEKVALTLEELKNMNHLDLNSMNSTNYQKLILYMESIQ